MDNSSLTFITCTELREEFSKCPNDINKRILIIDVRDAASYKESHLRLDHRNNIESIRRKMRVMNIDPDKLKFPTLKSILEILNDDDKKVIMNRRDATDVVIIDRNTDNIDQMAEPTSKVMRVINALTRYDNQPSQKIIVPIKILRGGFREWQITWPHFTTKHDFDPDNESTTKIDSISQPSVTVNGLSPAIEESKPITPPLMPKRPPPQPVLIPSTQTTRPIAPVSSSHARPELIVPPKPAKNAPGTAVPVIPSQLLKPALPRSHSSPNVAQADGDELENSSNELDKLTLSKAGHTSGEYGDVSPSTPFIKPKPRYDRALKPDSRINLVLGQLNFGRKPEASFGKAVTGLQNLGNTCFMNSVIQCLAYEPALVSYISSNKYFSDINFNAQYGTGGELAIEFGALVKELNSHRYRYIEPKSFREAVTKHVGFAGNEQQDSHEFMMMLFDKLHHDLNINAEEKYRQNGVVIRNGLSNNDESNINVPRATLGNQFWQRHLKMNKSIISDMFEGIFMSTLTCTVCFGQSNTFEVFNCLSLPIPSATRCHVRDCLSHFSNPERIEAAWECPRCKQKREADKKIVICKLPKILIIHLKRFSLDGRWRQKLQTNVDFPLNDLTVDCANVLPETAYSQKVVNATYNLCAVVNHFGHLDGGHYTAFCKLENQKWYTFDDSNVTEIEDEEKVCSPAAYILFYSAGS